MKELISISVVLIFCLSFLIFGTRESQAIAANFGIRRTGRKRAMNRNQEMSSINRRSICVAARELNCDEELKDKRVEDLFLLRQR